MLWFTCLQVQVTHTNIPRKYKVVGVEELGADKVTFLLENKRCTVQQYFAQKYRLNLRFPRLNLLRVAPETKKIYLPVEVRETTLSLHIPVCLSYKHNQLYHIFIHVEECHRYELIYPPCNHAYVFLW